MAATRKIPADLASAAAEAVRGLNHATLNTGRTGWEYPSDAYEVIGGLDQMARGLPQALQQVSRLLFELDADGHVRSDHGPAAVSEEVLTARTALRAASLATEQLVSALGRAHSATSPLAYQD